MIYDIFADIYLFEMQSDKEKGVFHLPVYFSDDHNIQG